MNKDEQGHLQPCAYYSKVFQSNQTHYPAYQQELLGIVFGIVYFFVVRVACDLFHRVGVFGSWGMRSPPIDQRLQYVAHHDPFHEW